MLRATSENFNLIQQFWGSKGQKIFQKGHFMDDESVRKHLKIYNLPGLCILIRSFFDRKLKHNLLGLRQRKRKTFQK